jgi:hypothetical protein
MDQNPSSSRRTWTGSSWILLSGFLVIIALILIVWQPLVQDYLRLFNPAYPWWQQVDWLLIAIFLFMSIAITLGADLRKDWLLVAVGFCGGFVIESWGTRTGLWSYYTGEQPPLWILPAWPIAALTIDRMAGFFSTSIKRFSTKQHTFTYFIVFGGFILLMASFLVKHGWHLAHLAAFLSVVILVFIPQNRNYSLVIFLAGALLGIFLEYWGTSRECWTYYTHEIPPIFAVFAHGTASVTFYQISQFVLWGIRQGTSRWNWGKVPVLMDDE